MFRASLRPSSGEQDRVLLHMVFCTDCVGCGCVELDRNLHTVHTAYDPAQSNSNLHTVHTAYDPAQSNSNLHTVHTTYDPAQSNSNLHTVHTAYDTSSTQPQPAQPVQKTICSNTRSCSPDDGHNDVRNMLS